MEKGILCKFWIWFIVVVLNFHFELATDVNNTAVEEIGGEYLVNMGKQLNKPALTLIGMTIKKLHPCGEWNSWSACTATNWGFFGIKRRTRTCSLILVNKASKMKTETGFSICKGVCPAGYNLTTHGFCMKVYMITTNQEDADTQCQTDGGNLINIDTAVKYGDVKNLNGLPATYIYIGGRRKEKNSPWVFWNGSQSGFFKWASGEPHNTSGQYCLVLNGNDELKLMHDGSCSVSRPFICEVDRLEQF